MALTLSGTNGVVGAGFTVDASGVSVTAGVGTFASIGAGVSVSAAGLTGALPTISAANCTNIPAANITGTLPAISGANLTGISAGITMADTWYVSSSFNGSATPISSNWSQYTSHNTGTIGSAMTQSSGVFTFPSTGIYEIWWFSQFFRSGQVNYAKVYCQVTTNNNTFTSVPAPYASVNSGGAGGLWYGNMTSSHILDVTDTSNVKVRFSADIETSGCAVEQVTVTFKRIGDT